MVTMLVKGVVITYIYVFKLDNLHLTIYLSDGFCVTHFLIHLIVIFARKERE